MTPSGNIGFDGVALFEAVRNMYKCILSYSNNWGLSIMLYLNISKVGNQ